MLLSCYRRRRCSIDDVVSQTYPIYCCYLIIEFSNITNTRITKSNLFREDMHAHSPWLVRQRKALINKIFTWYRAARKKVTAKYRLTFDRHTNYLFTTFWPKMFVCSMLKRKLIDFFNSDELNRIINFLMLWYTARVFRACVKSILNSVWLKEYLVKIQFQSFTWFSGLTVLSILALPLYIIIVYTRAQNKLLNTRWFFLSPSFKKKKKTMIPSTAPKNQPQF